MPIGVSDATTYCFVGPFWVILCSVITILYSDVFTSTYCYVSHYPLPLEDASIRLRLYILSLSCTVMFLRVLIVMFPIIHCHWKMQA